MEEGIKKSSHVEIRLTCPRNKGLQMTFQGGQKKIKDKVYAPDASNPGTVLIGSGGKFISMPVVDLIGFISDLLKHDDGKDFLRHNVVMGYQAWIDLAGIGEQVNVKDMLVKLHPDLLVLLGLDKDTKQ